MLDDVVVLVPGFMGFGRLGSLYYFADRVSATVRGALRARLGRAVPVVGVRTDPIGCLADRQRDLLLELDRLDAQLGGIERFHLVGHSTGGVDAELLTCQAPLAPGPWVEHGGERRRVASVTTISAPHYGTCLAESPAAGWLAHPDIGLGAIEAGDLVGALLRLFASRTITADGLEALLFSAPESALFVARMLTHRQLLDDLRPGSMVALRDANPPDPGFDVSVRCFVSVTPTLPVRIPGVPDACDGFFRRLHELTATYARGREEGETALPLEVLRRHLDRDHLVHNAGAVLEDVDVGSSDGVVNAARQLLTTRAPVDDPDAALGAIVVGDHADVLGHYDRQDGLMPGRTLNQGFFRSGSGFGDDEFFELWGRVAAHVADVALARSGAGATKGAGRARGRKRAVAGSGGRPEGGRDESGHAA